MHTQEDEALFVLEGAIEGRAGDRPFRVGPGDFVYLPRHVPHAWAVTSERARFLVWIAPAGFERSFLEFSDEAPEAQLPPGGPPDPAWQEGLLARENELGVRYEFQQSAVSGSGAASGSG